MSSLGDAFTRAINARNAQVRLGPNATKPKLEDMSEEEKKRYDELLKRSKNNLATNEE